MTRDAENVSPPDLTPSGPFVMRVTAAHVLAYFAAGLAADSMATLMRPIDDPLVAAGAGLQLVNGLVLGLVLAPFRAVLLGARRAAPVRVAQGSAEHVSYLVLRRDKSWCKEPIQPL